MKKVNYLMSVLCLTVAGSAMSVYAGDLLTGTNPGAQLSGEDVPLNPEEKQAQIQRDIDLKIQQRGITEDQRRTFEKNSAQDVLVETELQLIDLAKKIERQIALPGTGQNEDILLKEVQNKILDATDKASYAIKNFNRDTSSYYSQMKMRAAQAGQMARSGMGAATDYASDAYNSDTAANAGSMARGAAASASDMAKKAYNSETSKKMGDGMRSMGTAMGIPKMSSWGFGKKKEIVE